MTVYVGLDIGGTKLLAASAKGNREIVHRVHRPTPIHLDAGLKLLHEMIDEVAGVEKILGIGVAIGGPLDWETGVVSPLHQPEWQEVPLKSILETKWGCPVFVDVDTNIAAIGEYVAGKYKSNRLLYITLSTGMGGGFVMDGKIYRGMQGAHPEIAHQAIPYRCSYPERVVCECGAEGCLEALVSGNGIRRIYQKSPEHLDEDEWDEVAYNLGQGLRNLGAIYLPEIIVLGGGVALGGGERFLNRARKVMERGLKIVPKPELRFSKLGYDTALMGAVVASIQGIE
jgi:predicted NBD/HSP70 family sugar kinase